MFLRSPAGNLPSLTAAVDVGADAVYIGFDSATNVRNFPGLNFSDEEVREGIAYAHDRGKQVYITLNTYPLSSQIAECFRAVDAAHALDADAVIMADMGLLEYCRDRYPDFRIHLSVQAGAASAQAIRFYEREFRIACVILPRSLTLDQISSIRATTQIELEVFAFGSLCANYEGRCYLSSYLTGRSTNNFGACSPAEFLQFEETDGGKLQFLLNGTILNEYDQHEVCSYPTPCKGRLTNMTTGKFDYSFQEPLSLNALPLLGELAQAGVDAIKIEGRQRSEVYVEGVTRIFREAIDHPGIETGWEEELLPLCEGMRFSSGCLKR
ncbi:MAG: peptidase U32 family protein [Candidatus Latescibacterota bacterium]